MSMTLAQFEDAVQRALGNRGYDPSRLDQWINFAYMDLCGSVEFAILHGETTTATVNGQNYLDVPDNTLVIILVKDLEDDVLLGEIPEAEFYRRKITSGPPRRFCWSGPNIFLTPVPDDVRDMVIVTESSPSPLASASDTTVLADMWDVAIIDLAVHYGLFNTGNEQRSAAWLSRAISYIQSRMTEQDLKPKPGFAAMQEQLAQLQAAQGQQA